MHFNNLHLFSDNVALHGYKFSQLMVLHFVYRLMIEILWDVKTLGSHIFKTIYPIAVKFTGVM